MGHEEHTRVQLQQVLVNLILNGIEAMPDGSGELNVASRRTDDGQLLISVSNFVCVCTETSSLRSSRTMM